MIKTQKVSTIMFMLSRILWAGLEVVSVVVHHVVGSVPVAHHVVSVHHVHVVSPGGVAVGLVPGISIGLSSGEGGETDLEVLMIRRRLEVVET